MSRILTALGWKNIDPRIPEVMKTNKKIVLVFPHTSYWDSIIGFLYLFHSEELTDFRDRTRFVVLNTTLNNPLYNIFYKLMKCIPVGPPGSTGGGLDKIHEELDAMDEFILCLSPKGHVKKSEWRSGWYNIAKRYDATIIAVGADFEKQQLVMSGEPQKIEGRSKEELQDIFAQYFTQIIQYHEGRDILEERECTHRTVIEPNTYNFYYYIFLFVLLIVVLSVLLSVYIEQFFTPSDKIPQKRF
jgi:hypothetical protein